MVWADNVKAKSASAQPNEGRRAKARRTRRSRRELRRFVDWVSTYTLAPRGMVLRMSLRMGEHLGPARESVGVRLAGTPPKRMTAARSRVLALLADGLARGKGEAAQEAGVSPA